MLVYHSSAARGHDPRSFYRRGRPIDHPESIGRYEVLLKAVTEAGYPLIETQSHDVPPIAAVHDSGYLDLLSGGWSRAIAAEPGIDEILPTQFAPWTPHRRPEGLLGQLGYHMTDTSTPLRAGTWTAIAGAAHTAVDAADEAVRGGTAYALARPPGHHASAAHAGGFCYLNNAAVAAQRIVAAKGSAAILDIDVHHGNGTQAIFYDRADVLFVSLHAETSNYYPYFTGYAEETGEGAGQGYNQNLPLPLGSADDIFLDAIAKSLDRIAQFDPPALVLSLGLDAAVDDPIGAMAVTTRGFERAAALIASFGRPTAIIQEGGYLCEALPRNLAAFLASFDATDA
ncbi:histone deacetylase family protein [Sphingomonas psychrotolerans]|uniref:Histone deacetylase family protein n=1 Tax=Sphingomonas psychrotolerans TaxID=1327635 RepID=A0ABU3N8X0_9SPHN|nr:histone deacetylase family protein [Sphingomonas psychrotolerans]MDT8760927.1 histone deacetylase family protein [Sphingomonas psychrotolerans]